MKTFIYASFGVRKNRLKAANDPCQSTLGEARLIPGFSAAFTAHPDGSIRKHGRPLTGHLHRKGYRRVTIITAGKNKHFYVHSLIAAAFIGERPEGAHVDHLNFDKLDNRPENLRYLSSAENSGRRRNAGAEAVRK